jgi:estrogen-related receptor beta like 1
VLLLENYMVLFLVFVAAPLVNIKKAISQIKSEITGMDVRVGVLEHSLLQARLRDKNLLQQDMNAPVHALV